MSDQYAVLNGNGIVVNITVGGEDTDPNLVDLSKAKNGVNIGLKYYSQLSRFYPVDWVYDSQLNIAVPPNISAQNVVDNITNLKTETTEQLNKCDVYKQSAEYQSLNDTGKERIERFIAAANELLVRLDDVVYENYQLPSLTLPTKVAAFTVGT
jgi:hypothetical protein